jgi:hypothetical protein
MASHLSYDVLSRLVEHRAATVEEARAQRHLAGCGRCRSELAWLERIRSLPQHGTPLIESASSIDSHADGWGNGSLGQPRGATNHDMPGRSAPADDLLRGVAAHWLRPGSSALLG